MSLLRLQRIHAGRSLRGACPVACPREEQVSSSDSSCLGMLAVACPKGKPAEGERVREPSSPRAWLSLCVENGIPFLDLALLDDAR